MECWGTWEQGTLRNQGVSNTVCNNDDGEARPEGGGCDATPVLPRRHAGPAARRGCFPGRAEQKE